MRITKHPQNRTPRPKGSRAKSTHRARRLPGRICGFAFLKNRRIWLAALAAFAVLLAGCGGPAPAPSGQTAASSAPGGQQAFAGTSGPLQPLSPDTGEGRYCLGRGGQEGLFWYIDYAAASAAPLCSRPGCDHTEPDCPARLPDAEYVGTPQALGGGQIVFVAGSGGSETIWLAEADGSGRRLLAGCAAGEYGLSLAAGDGAYLYYARSFGKGGLAFARVPLAGGEPEELFCLPEGEFSGCQLLGCEGRGLVLYTWETDPIPPITPAGDSPEAIEEAVRAHDEALTRLFGRRRVLWINVDTGEESILDAWESPLNEGENRSLLWANGRLYWCDTAAAGPIFWLDAAGGSGEAGRLPESLNVPGGVFTLAGTVQNHLLINRYDPAADVLSRYALPLGSGQQGGELLPLPLSYMANAFPHPVYILGQGANALLVEYEEREQPREGGFYEDGTPITGTDTISIWGMIPYEDYFAGQPAYRTIEGEFAR